MDGREKRKNIRVPFRTEVIVSHGGKELHFEGDSVNLSMGGIFARPVETEIGPGDKCLVQLRLTGTHDPLELSMTGKGGQA